MAIGIESTATLLPPDQYAKIMAIDPCLWNQVDSCEEPSDKTCDYIWLQHGWLDDDNTPVAGREDVIRAINVAESMIVRKLGFYPVPVWVSGEEHGWPYPKRGTRNAYPPLNANWGYIIEGGIKQTLVLEEAGCVDGYSGTTKTSTATITLIIPVATAGDDLTNTEIRVFWTGHDQDPRYEIRPLDVDVTESAGDTYTITITGYRYQFALPDLQVDTEDVICIEDDDNFAAACADDYLYPGAGDIDIVRVWNDSSQQAQIVYKSAQCGDPICSEVCQNACIAVRDKRTSKIYTPAATYSSDSWTKAALNYSNPSDVRLWYRAGYPLNAITDQMDHSLSEAIVRLANTLLPEAPCGCEFTRSVWKRDREEVDINSANVAMAASAFGTTMRGAVWAMTICNTYNPLSLAGNV